MSDTAYTDEMSFDYHFTPAETAVLARFLRARQSELPEELAAFSIAVERAVYNAMSIDEVERFYS